MNTLRFCSVFFLLVLFFLTFNSAGVQAEFMGLNEVEVGMEGYGRTVFSGTEVTEFPVQVKAIVQSGYKRELILVKTGGPEIEGIGGIAMGMSGSPVYLDGRLIGAIAYGWQYSDHRLALITPIEEMLALWEEDGRKGELPEKKRVYVEGYGELEFEPVATPLLTFGLGERAQSFLKDELDMENVKVLTGSNSRVAEEDRKPSLEPGSAISVDLMRGDMGLSYIGTLTHLEDDRIMGFGHPLFNQGPVDLFFSQAYIHEVIPSLSFPFKLASPLEVKGLVSQDRGAGISGYTDIYPSLIPVQFTMTDRDREIRNRASIQIVGHEGLVPVLVTTAGLEVGDETLDRIGPGIANVKVEITTDAVPEGKVQRENVFFSSQDIAVQCLQEVHDLLYIIASNPFKRASIYNIRITAEMFLGNPLAMIKDVQVSEKEVHAGQEVLVDVTLQPFRHEPVTRTFSFKVPPDMPAGGASLLISGGYSWGPYENNDFYDPCYFDDLPSLVKSFVDQPRNDHLIFELYPYFYPEPEEGGEVIDPQDVELRELFRAGYVVEGFWSVEIEVVDNAPEDS